MVDDDDNTIAEGNVFGSHTFNEFNFAQAWSVPEPAQAGTLVVAPNPSAGNAVAMLHLNRGANVKAQLVGPLGNVVRMWDHGFMSAGEQSFRLDCEDLPAGLYILRVMAGKQAVTAKVSIVK
ncbi:MAG: T9SS type A sorting domain-containing protein [Desulfobacterales bacterium]|nr:T9SS type A sorting domain-containing protein [Desulfobacterales bacterium]